MRYFNDTLHADLTPIFDQYLRYTAIPILELKREGDTVSYRWKADVPNFAMPVRAGGKLLHPTTEWQTMTAASDLEIDPNLYYINVQR